MRKLRIVLGVFLLSTLAATGLAFAGGVEELQPVDGTTCGAWEPRGGPADGFQRICFDGSLYWYEYR